MSSVVGKKFTCEYFSSERVGSILQILLVEPLLTIAKLYSLAHTRLTHVEALTSSVVSEAA